MADNIQTAYKTMIHPKTTNGERVYIHRPHQDTPVSSWEDKNQIATITPESKIIDHFGIKTHIPNHKDKNLHGNFDEPALDNSSGKPLASGTIIHSNDGRIVVIHPTNKFGGYEATFPKGKLEQGLSLRENAIKEANEETGLTVQLLGHATDVERSTSVTRYYHAKIIGGHPKDMGWETQAVSMVPKEKLHLIATHPNDQKIVKIAKNFTT